MLDNCLQAGAYENHVEMEASILWGSPFGKTSGVPLGSIIFEMVFSVNT